MAKQITVRGVSQELSRRLDELSRARGRSLNATVLDILEAATGVDREARLELLKRYTTWTPADGEEFDEALRAQRVVDEEVWR